MSRWGREVSREPIDLASLHGAEGDDSATWSASDDPELVPDEHSREAAEPETDDYAPRDPDRGIVVPRAQRRPRRGRALLVLLLVIAIPVAAAGVGVVWFQHRLDGSPGGQPVTVTIAPRTSTNSIANLLDQKGVIDSTLAFRLYTRVFHHSKLHAGTFHLREHMGVRAAVAALEKTTTPPRLVLAIRPGLWLNEIAVQVHDQLHLNPFRFVQLVKSGAVRSRYQPAGVTTTEGLLYPDTYYFTPQSTELDVVRAMVHRFDEVADLVGVQRAAAARGVSAYDAIKVAALIQSEAKYSADGPLVASAIYNRLAAGMPLDIDAMILYFNGTHSTKDFARLRAIDSPYNSYLHPGLGPTPISAATEANLDAAVHAPRTTYLYWVNADCAGHLVFATTLQQQTQNVAHYDGLKCG